MISNINTKSYWNDRFASGDWEAKSGRSQTTQFAYSQIEHFDIPKEFTGAILDFGCGLGDAFPIYKKAFPKARLMGIDISEEAIKKCKESFGHLAEFICGTNENVPIVDVIIASNVFEHLSYDKVIAKVLLSKCTELYIIVPYLEIIQDNSEHINSYDEFYFDDLGCQITYKKYFSKGWGHVGLSIYYHIYLKNIARLLCGIKLKSREKQIMFKLSKTR